ncbi:MAG: phage holin family protein [Burkholderia sp.]|nr:phage holin family protein [Burkholderia sp.]
MTLILTWIINTLALLITTHLIPSIHIKNLGTALIVTIFLGLINMVIRPILILFTLPITVITLGLFIFVINAICFWIGAEILKGFDISGFWSAFLGSIFYSIISWWLSILILE